MVPLTYGAEKKPEILKTIKGMSLDEKIGQMILVYHSPYSFLKKYHIGSVLIMSNMLKQPEKLSRELKSIQSKMPIKILVSMDQEGGKVNRLGRIKKWQDVPSAKMLKTLSHDSIVAFNQKVADALVELNINVNLAPVLDPTHNFLGKPVFMSYNGRSFGKNDREIVPPAKSFIEGFSNKGVMCISKHFPGYDVPDNSDHHIAVSQADSASVLKNTLAFKQTINYVGGVMMSSIHYEKFSKHPSVFSKKIVSWARNMDSEKLIITDDLWGAALRGYTSQKDSVHPINYPDEDFARLTEMAFLAGNDLLMITFPKKVEIIQETIKKLCKKNPDLLKQVDESVYRVLNAKMSVGLL